MPQSDLLYRALKLNPYRDIVSFVGGGGKTSSILRLAKELSENSKKIIITTTTHIDGNLPYPVIKYPSALTLNITADIKKRISSSPVILAKRQVRGEKLKGITEKQINEIIRHADFDYILIEADGAAGKPLKAPHNYEPQVPSCTTVFCVVIGYDALGLKNNIENTHRPQLIARITGKPIDSIITHEDIVALLSHPHGLLKGRPAATRTAVIINKVSASMISEAQKLAMMILEKGRGINAVICGEINSARQLQLFS